MALKELFPASTNLLESVKSILYWMELFPPGSVGELPYLGRSIGSDLCG